MRILLERGVLAQMVVFAP